MQVTRVLAELMVSDLDTSVAWYSALFGREPDAQPMDGLVEWHFQGAGSVQVFQDPDSAGRSAVTLAITDLDAALADLDAAGVDHEPPMDATSVRLAQLSDPDGNAVVLTEPLDAG